jgi:hypothetical protein
VRRLSREFSSYASSTAFSAKGTLAAVELSPGVIHLIDVAARRSVAKLEDPHGDRARWLDLLRANLNTPDNQFLAMDLYFLAMSHKYLDESAEAREARAQADRWMREHPNLSALKTREFRNIRREVDAVFGSTR